MRIRHFFTGITAFSLAAISLMSASARAQVLTADDFRQIGEQGFGLRANSYAWSMAYFRGRLYIGTNHNFLCIVRSIRGITSNNAEQEVPVDCDPNLLDMDLRARIYAYDPATNEVELVYISPTVKALSSDGTLRDVAVDLGYRTMLVHREPDSTEALYVGTYVTTEVTGPPPRILRSVDGRRFDPLPGKISNDPTLVSYRSLTSFNGRLYTLAIGRIDEATDLLESADPASGEFRKVNPPHFGDPANISAFELEVFKGYLYLGTATADQGFQLLKTKAVGQTPYVFQKVLTDGAYRGSRNQNVVSLQAFGDYLYVGTGLNFVALDFFPGVEAAAAELLRVAPDESWEIVCGEPRETPDGDKFPITGKLGGCGNSRTGYIWRMAVHNNRLYMGTFDMSLFARFATTEGLESSIDLDIHPIISWVLERIPAGEIADIIAAIEGGFDLWETKDGREWRQITRTGLEDEYAYGVRSFASTPYGLFLGTANPYFGFNIFLGQEPGVDSDGDSFTDAKDNCPTIWNLDQRDRDDDGVGDACDWDMDGDCVANANDDQPMRPAPAGTDTDGDGQPDGCDADDDDDSIPDTQDNCRLAANMDQADSDGDGVGDVCQAGASGGTSSGSGNGASRPVDAEPEDEAELNPADRPAGSFCGNGAALALVSFGLILLTVMPRSRQERPSA